MNYKDIQDNFNAVLAYSQDGLGDGVINTDELFAEWYENKRDFIEAFGGQLIYEWPEEVHFELGPKERQKRIDDFLSMIDYRWANSDLIDFIETQRDGFFSNRTVIPYTYLDTEIPVGMKLVKAFKYFVNNSDRALEDIQSAASMIIQEDKVSGQLCLSVHPLDFLSASENTHNWRSCHALDGEYRSGNLSYMRDKSTIICYIKSKRNEILPNFPNTVPWNSKKWRVLLFFSGDWNLIFAGRQYPFATSTGLNFIKDRVLMRLLHKEWKPWTDKSIDSIKMDDTFGGVGYTMNLETEYLPLGRLIPKREVIINEPMSLMFNDLLISSCYKPMYTIAMDAFCFLSPPRLKDPKVRIGGGVKCCRCGQRYISLEESFLCDECELAYGSADCEDIITCACCGRRVWYDETTFLEYREESICRQCAETEITYCEGCGEYYYNDDVHYDEIREEYLCEECGAYLDKEEYEL